MDDFEKMISVVQPGKIGYAPGVPRARRRRRRKGNKQRMGRMRICRCGALFQPKSWQVKHHKDKLCPDCTVSDPRWSSAYQSQRSLRMVKAGYKCEDCGSRKKLECHHVDGDPTNHALDNLRILCKDCHQPHTNIQRVVRNMQKVNRPGRARVTSGYRTVAQQRELEAKTAARKGMRLT